MLKPLMASIGRHSADRAFRARCPGEYEQANTEHFAVLGFGHECAPTSSAPPDFPGSCRRPERSILNSVSADLLIFEEMSAGHR